MATLVSAVPLHDENSNSTYPTVVTSKSLSSIADAHEYSDYWNEYREIETIHQTHPPDEEDDAPKTADECEQEDLTWLKEVGYGHLATRYKDGHDFTDEELEMLTTTLTHQQARVVKSRVVNLTSTWRRRPRLASKTDVRDIFPQEEEEVVVDRLRRTESTPVGNRGGRRGSKGREPLVKRNVYPIMAATNEVADDTDSDITALSIHPQSPVGQNQTLTAISDSDVTLQFIEASEDDKEERNNRLEYTDSDKRDTLPHFILVKDEMGITRVADLCLLDLERIGSLALIELTGLFDIHNIIYSRRKHKRKNKESGIFGVTLESLVEQDEKFVAGTTVPIFFQQITTHLEKTALSTEGILRIPGSASRLKNLRQSIEEKFTQNAPFAWDDVFPNDAAGLLKQFLRELPTPLLTFQYLDAFLQIESQSP